MRWLAVAVIVLGAGVASASPRATDADAVARLETARSEIRAHMHALRYPQARDAAKAALAIGAAGPAEVAELARTLGETSAALDAPAEAEAWFLVWLMLDPTADLPAGTSPKLTAPLAAARARVPGPLVVTFSDRSGTATIDIAGDPDQYVAVAEIATTDHRGLRAARLVPLRRNTSGARQTGMRDPIEHDERDLAAIDVSLRDAHGNELLAVHRTVPTKVVTDPVPVRVRRSLLRRPWPYLIGAAVTAGLGGVFVWRRSVAKDDLAAILADSENHTFEQAEAARHRAERHGWLSVASFATAGVLAATAVFMATRGDEHTVIVAPLRDGAAILMTSQF